jgi:hypothetical protein
VLYDKENSSVNGYTVQVDRSKCSPIRARNDRLDESRAYQIRQSTDIQKYQGVNMPVRDIEVIEQNVSADIGRRLRSSPKKDRSRSN